jgi:hypothetical protein
MQTKNSDKERITCSVENGRVFKPKMPWTALDLAVGQMNEVCSLMLSSESEIPKIF